jgi:hypothetical protein
LGGQSVGSSDGEYHCSDQDNSCGYQQDLRHTHPEAEDTCLVPNPQMSARWLFPYARRALMDAAVTSKSLVTVDDALCSSSGRRATGYSSGSAPRRRMPTVNAMSRYGIIEQQNVSWTNNRDIGKVRQGVISLCSVNAGSLRLGDPNGTRIPIKPQPRIPQPEPESQRAKVAVN